MQHKLYKYLFLLIFFVFGSALAQAQPQAYPQRNIRVIIPGAAGDTCDMMLRLIGTKFLEKTGMSFIMDNRVGASGQLGLQLIAQAPTDGYTIGCGQGGNMVIIPLAYKKVAYDSFKEIGRAHV